MSVHTEIKKIQDWHSATENVLNQTFPKLDDEHSWQVYKLNAQDIKAKLSSMQDAFNIICQKTAHFFDVNQLIKQEKSTYDYLADLIEFVYDEAYKKQAFTTHLKQDVKAWKEGKRQDILANFEQLGNIEKVEQQPDDKVKSAIIAIHELLWRFTEIHHQLTTKNVNIQKWLQKLLASIDVKLTHQLSLLKPELEVYQKYETIIQEVRLRERNFDKEACHQYWQEDMVLIGANTWKMMKQ